MPRRRSPPPRSSPHAALGSAHCDHASVTSTLLGGAVAPTASTSDASTPRDAAPPGRRRGRRPTSPAADADRPHRRRPAPRGSRGGRGQLPDDRRIADDQEGVTGGPKPGQRAHRVDLARQFDAGGELHGPGQREARCPDQDAITRARMAPRPFTSPPARARPAAARRPSAATSTGTTRSGTRSVATASPSSAEADTTSTLRRTARVARLPGHGRVQIGASAGQRTGRDPRRGVEADGDVTVARPAHRLSELGDHQRCPRGVSPPCARPPRSPGRSPRRAPRSTVAPRPWPGHRHGRRHPRRSGCG